MNRYGIALRLALAALVAMTAACNEPAPPAGEATDVPATVVTRDVAVTMRDGVVLRADIYRPAGPGPFPVLVYRTPYGKHQAVSSYDTHTAAVARGYAVVLQDVRGRYASDGHFEPYRNEGTDGFDTIEWAAAQPWSNGDVGTFGLSYPGAVQWLAATESPPHLKAMAPAMTFSSPRNFFYMNGVFDLSWLPWIYVNIAPDARERLDLPGIRDRGEAADTWADVADEYRGWLPLAELPHLRDAAPWYYEWLEHPPADDWWDWAEIRGRYDRTDAAVLNLSGWHDEAYGPEGAVTNFNGLVDARAGDNDPRTHLVLGPWTHGVHSTESGRVGDLDFGAAAAIDYDDTVLDFFDHYLRGIDNRYAGAPPVRYFVMGENRWHDAAAWPPRDAAIETLYLRAGNGELRLASAPAADEPATTSAFTSDPRNPVTDPHDAFGPRDYDVLRTRDDVLTFDSDPFETATTVAGAVEAVIHASCDCRDFDLWVRLYDVHPDGRAFNLMSPGNDMLRASYRDPATAPQRLEPGQVYELRLDDLLTGIRFAPGHRLRVQVSASFAPHFSRNLQTGRSETVSAEARKATITIHHGPAHPSRVRLPVVP